MNLSQKDMQTSRERALTQIIESKERIQNALKPVATETAQLATWRRIQAKPQLQERIRTRYDKDEWARYEEAMQALESRWSGKE